MNRPAPAARRRRRTRRRARHEGLQRWRTWEYFLAIVLAHFIVFLAALYGRKAFIFDQQRSLMLFSDTSVEIEKLLDYLILRMLFQNHTPKHS